MALTKKEIKQRHFDKVYQQAEIIKCKCGCGKELKDKDRYGRSIEFINGHNGRKYEDSTQYKREWNYRNKESRRIYRKKTRQNRKGILIRYKGGKCEKCGLEYNGTNRCVFDFHHTSGKDFEISGNMMEKSLEKLKKEADKCLLLCSNCHRPKHSDKY
jgi:hypothetical protein